MNVLCLNHESCLTRLLLVVALLVSKNRTAGNKDSSLGLLYCGGVDK